MSRRIIFTVQEWLCLCPGENLFNLDRDAAEWYRLSVKEYFS